MNLKYISNVVFFRFEKIINSQVLICICIAIVNFGSSEKHSGELFIIKFVQGFIFLEEIFLNHKVWFIKKIFSFEPSKANSMLIIWDIIVLSNQIYKNIRYILMIAWPTNVEINKLIPSDQGRCTALKSTTTVIGSTLNHDLVLFI